MATKLRRKVLLRDDFGLCVLLPKTLWAKVPEPGNAFVATVDGERRRLRVESEPCSCRGHVPHEHRFLKLPTSMAARPNSAVMLEV
jgi:hypothetical protein